MHLANTYPLGQLAQKDYNCVCGKNHKIATREILFGENVVNELCGAIERCFGARIKIALVAQREMFNLAGAEIEVALERGGFRVERIILDCALPDILCANPILKISEDVRVIVGVGGGTVADLVKYAAACLSIECAIVGTSCATDAYLAPSSMLKRKGFWEIFSVKPPMLFAAMLSKALVASPKLIAAGFGNAMAKLVSLFDWELANRIINEPLCPVIFELAESAVDVCLENGEQLRGANKSAIAAIFEQNVRLSWLMQALGNTRLACGGETHMAHALQMLQEYEQSPIRLYGENLFICAQIVNRFYLDSIKKRRPVFTAPPDNLFHLEKLVEYLGVDEALAIKKLQPYPKPQNLRIFEHKLTEYAPELLVRLEKNQKIFAKAHKYFCRIYPDCGYWIKNYISQSDVEVCLALAPDLREKFTYLLLLKNMGDLECLI